MPGSRDKQQLNDRKIETLWREFCADTGDRDRVFDEMAVILGARAYGLALRSVADPHLAEDIAQEALVRLYRHAAELKDGKAVSAWFYRITLNLVNDFYRKVARRSNALSKLETLRQLEEQAKVQPLVQTEKDQLREAIQQALKSLDEKHREVFVLKEIEGRSHAEIAVMLEIPEGTVWSRLSHARNRLRSLLISQGVRPES